MVIEVCDNCRGERKGMDRDVSGKRCAFCLRNLDKELIHTLPLHLCLPKPYYSFRFTPDTI